jgi:misacylated tRNA(Ala) deacylase
MGNSPNRYLDEPRLYELSTKVVASQTLQFGGWSIAAAETIFRPGGGGQPDDHGSVEIHGTRHEVQGLHKAEGKVFMHLPSLSAEPRKGTVVELAIDSNRRDQLSKSHTLQHIFSVVTHQVMPSAEVTDTGIYEDASGAWIKVKLDSHDETSLYAIDRAVRSVVLKGIPVWAQKMKSVEQCEWEFGALFRNDSKASLSGKVRLVIIEDFDANCCSGTHWHSSNVGPYAMIHAFLKDAPGVVRIEFILQNAWSYWYPESGRTCKLKKPS